MNISTIHSNSDSCPPNDLFPAFYSLSSAKRRMSELRVQIAHYDHLYYEQAESKISDREYDALYHELVVLEDLHPELVVPDSPTQKVPGASKGAFTQANHLIAMQSLDNTYCEKEVVAFVNRLQRLLHEKEIPLTIEPKVDGVAIALLYKKGHLLRAVTRGDGRVGDDVTRNILTIPQIPSSLKGRVPNLLEVRGEIFLSKEIFSKINADRVSKKLPIFANPRNAAAGTLKNLDLKVVAERNLSAVFYGFGAFEPSSEGSIPATLQEFFACLKEWGLPIDSKIWIANTADEVIKWILHIGEIRHTFPFEIDGAVIKVDQLSQHTRLGSTSRAPRWAIAYKYEAEQVETRLLGIKIQVGRSGILTPVAELAPVFVDGSTIARATLHNEEEIIRKDLRIGDWVVVEKAGNVIPSVVGVLSAKRNGNEREFRMPKICPSCAVPVTRMQGEIAVRCPNYDCFAQVQRRIMFFVDNRSMGIAGIGEAMVTQLVKKKMVDDIAGLYALTADQLLSIERMGEKSVKNLLSAIEASKQKPLWRLLTALGIPHVGISVAQNLASCFKTMERIEIASIQELCQIEEVGEVMATAIYRWFRDTKNLKLLEKLRIAGLNFGERDSVSPNPFLDSPLRGSTWVLTGTLSIPRDDAVKIICSFGGKVITSVSAKVTYLLAGKEAGNKLSKAEKLGVKVLSEDEFQIMIDQLRSIHRNPEYAIF